VEAAGVTAAAAMEVTAATTAAAGAARVPGVGKPLPRPARGHMARDCPRKKEKALLAGVDEEATLL
jgi:hypothetical protein